MSSLGLKSSPRLYDVAALLFSAPLATFDENLRPNIVSNLLRDG